MLSSFRQIIRKLQSHLSDEFFSFPQGNTDSEWAFALFLQLLSIHISPLSPIIPHALLRKAMLETIYKINEFTEELGGVVEPSLLNFCVTDGKSVVATRYISSMMEEAASLYFSTGSSFEEYEAGGHYRMTKADKREDIILIASEPLTFERADWIEVPSQTCIVITPRVRPLSIPSD